MTALDHIRDNDSREEKKREGHSPRSSHLCKALGRS